MSSLRDTPGKGELPAKPAQSPRVIFDNQPVEHIEALIEDDKRFFQHLRPDLEALREELEQTEELCRREERETASKRAECDRLVNERRHLEEQLEALQRQLRGSRSKREVFRSAQALGRGDGARCAREAAFMRRVVEEMARDIAHLEKAVSYLEYSNPGIVSHAQALGERKREIADQVRHGTQQLRLEQMEGDRAREILEVLQRDGAAVQLWGETERREPLFAPPPHDAGGPPAPLPCALPDRGSAVPAGPGPRSTVLPGRPEPMELREGV